MKLMRQLMNKIYVKNANNEIDKITEEKYALEAEYRKLQAEVVH